MLQGSGMKSTQELTEDLRSRILFIPNSGSTMAAWDPPRLSVLLNTVAKSLMDWLKNSLEFISRSYLDKLFIPASGALCEPWTKTTII